MAGIYSGTKQQAGFTLVELAVVVTIIGLLIGGTLKGKEMLDNSRINATIIQIKSYDTAVNTFQNMYRDLPGDMMNAQSRIDGCTTANGCLAGNGDGMIGTGGISTSWFSGVESSDENQNFWKHLQLASLITGVDVSWKNSNPKKFGASSPASMYDPAVGFHAKSYLRTLKNQLSGYDEVMNGLTLVLSIRPGGEWNEDVDSLPPYVVYRIDDKIDDGVAFSGEVIGVSTAWGTGCGGANLGENKANGYNATQSERRCDMAIIIRNQD